MTDVLLVTKTYVGGFLEKLRLALKYIQVITESVKITKSSSSWKLFSNEVKSIMFRYLRAKKIVGCSKYSTHFASPTR